MSSFSIVSNMDLLNNQALEAYRGIRRKSIRLQGNFEFAYFEHFDHLLLKNNDLISMRINQLHRLLVIVPALLALDSGSVFSKEASTALEMARQLNQAFIEVADQVSPAV